MTDQQCGIHPSLEADVFNRDCPSRTVVQNIGGRWGTLALVALHDGPHRFGVLRRHVDGVSERMLSQTLQSLEHDGLVHRTVLEAIPPKVEYSLTEFGTEVAERLHGLIELVESRLPDVLEARANYARKNTPAQ